MIRALFLSFSLLLFGQATTLAEPTTVTFTIKNYREFEKGVRAYYSLFNPGADDEEYRLFFQNEFKMKLFKGIDPELPWQLVMGFDSFQNWAPVLSYRIPVADYEVFRQNYQTAAAEDGNFNATITREGDYAKIWEEQKPHQELKQRHDLWKPTDLTTGGKWLDISLKLGASARGEILQQLGMIQMMSSQMFNQMPKEDLPGIDPQALAEVMTFQFSQYRMFVQDLETMGITLETDPAAVVLEGRIKALPESEMAGYLRSPDTQLNQVNSLIDQSGMLYFAGQLGENPKILDSFKKLSVLSMKIHEGYATENSEEVISRLMEQLFPKQLAGKIEAGSPVKFTYAYYYPDFDPAAFRKTMAQLAETMQSMAGVDKPFRQFALQFDYEEIDGVPVDRLLTVMNLEHSMYRLQTPGQRAAFNLLWNQGVMDIRMAYRGDYVFLGTSEEIGKLLDQPAAVRAIPHLNRNTVLYLKVSPFELTSWFAKLQGITLFEVKKPDLKGTDISVQVDFLGNEIQSRIVLPLKFLSELARLSF